MSNSNNCPYEQGNDLVQDTNIYEDEINLVGYFRVIWKQKWFITAATVLPTLAVGLILFLSPRSYKMTYVYDVRNDDVRNDDVRDDEARSDEVRSDEVRGDVSNWNLNEKNYNVMLSRFYSEENLSKLADKMQKNGLDEYAGQIRGNTNGVRNFVEFKPTPAFMDLSKLKISDPAQLLRIRQMEALLLNVTITGKAKGNMQKISSVIRDNIENVTPLYIVQEQLRADIRGYKNRQSEIENSRFTSNFTLKQNREVLTSLKKIDSLPADNVENNVMLRFDIGSQSQYLPIRYQAQAIESKIVALEQQLIIDEAKYKYYADLLGLMESLHAELGNKLSADYSITQFKSFLTSLINDYEKQEIKDYLRSYTMKIENRISASRPVTERPNLEIIAKGTVKKSGVVFVVSLMISIFFSFLLEGLKKSGTAASKPVNQIL